MSTETTRRTIGIRGAVEVRPVLSHADRERFVRFPWRIYANDPQWSPPLLLDRREFINPAKHPFFLHGDGIALLAWRNGQPVGRILVSDDPSYNAHNGTNAGCFGMFESEDDADVAHALLDAAAAWLSKRGRTQMLGPIDYSTNYACGLLIDGFDTPPRVMMNHNPAYYQPLLESWGLTKEKDLYAWWFDNYEQINAWRPRVERLAKRYRVTVRHVRRSELAADLRDLLAVYNEAWKDNWGHVPMTDAEFKYMAKQLIHIAVPELLLVAEVDGQPVGCSMTLPDFNEATGPLDGRLFRFGLPIGAWKLWRGLKRIKTARLLALGVVKAFRRRGIAELLILRTADYGAKLQRYGCAELGWTLEDNSLINHTISTVGGYQYKTYRIFSCALGQDLAQIESIENPSQIVVSDALRRKAR